MNITLTAITDRGLEREINEDSFTLCPHVGQSEWFTPDNPAPPDLHSNATDGALVVVADGMGGAAAGDVASQKTVEIITRLFTDNASSINSAAQRETFLTEAIATIDEELKQHAIDHFETAGMGTTVVMVWMDVASATVAWCGDSRCYFYRPDEILRRVSHDHSYVQQLVDSGLIKPDEAITHPESNIITRCLGDTDTAAQPDTTSLHLQEGDLLLLCSDGLCGYVTDKAIESIVQSHYPDINAIRNALLQAAIDTGGYDNITIALALVGEGVPQRHPSFFNRLFNRFGAK